LKEHLNATVLQQEKRKIQRTKYKIINQDLIAGVGIEIGNHLGKTCRLYKVGHSIADFGCMSQKVGNSSAARGVKEMEEPRYCPFVLF